MQAAGTFSGLTSTSSSSMILPPIASAATSALMNHDSIAEFKKRYAPLRIANTATAFSSVYITGHASSLDIGDVQTVQTASRDGGM